MALSELSFYDENIPCLAACPVNTNAGMYVAAIADGDDELAYLTARMPNPFASVCGRVCPQEVQCESQCVIGRKLEPVAIGRLERFVGDHGRQRHCSQGCPRPGFGRPAGTGCHAGAGDLAPRRLPHRAHRGQPVVDDAVGARRTAVVDLGSNSFRLVVFTAGRGWWRPDRWPSATISG